MPILSSEAIKAGISVYLNVKEGEFITIIGGNGAGKSTLFNVISGSMLCDSGNIVLDGEDITYMLEHKRASFIGRIFQDPMKGSAPNMTVGENLMMIIYFYLKSTKKCRGDLWSPLHDFICFFNQYK